MARTVLLADDSVTAQNMGRRILTDAGYEVITVNNGSAALKKIHESRPDLIVLDVYMPGYGGLEVCQRLKESDATMRIPVLLTVGKMEPFKTDEAKRVRADGHIIKPFDASELLAALTRLEDRIVPQSEGGKGRSSKSDAKKSRRLKGEEIAADEDDDLRNDRISYLEEMKRKHAKPLKEDSPEPAPELAKSEESLTGIERQARTAWQEIEDAVTFAAGPIYQPVDAAKPAPEFPVEKEADEAVSEQPKLDSRQEEASAAPAEANKEEEGTKAEPTAAEAAVSSEAADNEAEPAKVESEPAVKAVSAPRWIAENVALTAEEASRSLDEEMRQAQAVSEPVTQEETKQEVAQAEARPSDQEEPQPKTETETEGAAFAAAAASGSSSSADAISSNPTPESSQSPEPTAQENWERVRDTVVGQQVAEAIAQTVAAMAENSAPVQDQASVQPETSSSPQTATEQPDSQTPGSGDALSSIVDNVLAELKPRLLAEIAKQLSNDKK